MTEKLCPESNAMPLHEGQAICNSCKFMETARVLVAMGIVMPPLPEQKYRKPGERKWTYQATKSKAHYDTEERLKGRK